MDDKVRAVAAKHGVPDKLLLEALEYERQKVVLKKRRLVPVMIELIERYAAEGESSGKDGSAHGD